MITSGEALRTALEAAVEAQVSPAARFIGRVERDRIVAVFGVDSWTGEDCELFMAATPRGLSRDLLGTVSDYLFGMLGCTRITCRVKATNGPMLALIERLGFTQEGRLRRALQGTDVLVFGMLKEECPWARNRPKCHPRQTRRC